MAETDWQQQVTIFSTENLAERYKRLGLGRGVDITKRKPWMEKSDDFQMRAVHSQDLIETDEGGLLMDTVSMSTAVLHCAASCGPVYLLPMFLSQLMLAPSTVKQSVLPGNWCG